MQLTIGHLYPDIMNIYADRGNIIALVRRAQWRGLAIELHNLCISDTLNGQSWDILFIGGGQDREQLMICDDLQKIKGPYIREAVEAGTVLLSICGGYQLMGKYFRTSSGLTLPGIELFDVWTVAGDKRRIGDVIVECTFSGEKRTLVGFENHSGKTYLGSGARPLGRILFGWGNNAEDRSEGTIYKNAYGTYLHGSLLPKNPWFTDHLLLTALRHRYGDAVELRPLDDSLEYQAHKAVIQRIRQRGRLNTGAI
ncbi:MAG: glutamine amidotransferase [Chloroflexi bacterium]|nr:glutamine amidotransferase [Chloroflexota bacterium]MCL5074249.1 glutamine amidotransferase [Chloroflexota bacterium]